MFKNLFQKCRIQEEWGKKITEYLIYISVALIPLIFLPNINSVFSFPKLYVFRIVTAIIIFIWGFRLLLKKDIEIKWLPVLWFFAAYGFISLINTVFTVNIWTSLFGNYGYFIGFFTLINFLFWAYIVMSEINTIEKIKLLLWISVITSFVISVYGIFQHENWIVNVFTWSQDPTDRVFSTIGHSNHTAAYVAMNLMVLLGLINNSLSRWKNILVVFMGVTMGVMILMTASRGGILALIVGLLCWLIYGFHNKKIKLFLKKYLKIIAVIFCILLLAAIAFRNQIAELEVVKRTGDTFDFIQKGNIPDRVSWWMSSLEIFKDKPFLGSGLSTFRDVYNQYRRTDYRLPDDIQDGITPEAAHMEYLNILSTQGIIGLVVYIAMIIAVFVFAKKLIKESDDESIKKIVFAVSAGIAVYLVQVLFSFGVIATLFMLYTLFGVLFAFKNSKIKIIPGAWLMPVRISGSIMAVFILITAFYFSVLQFSSESLYKHAEVFASKRLYPEAIETYQQAIKLSPFNHEFIEGYADFLFNLGIGMPDSAQIPYLEDAVKFYDQALLINTSFPSVHVNKGLAVSRLADLNRSDTVKFKQYKDIALDEMKSAAEIGKNNPLYTYKYAQMLLFFGDKEGAKLQFENVLKLRNPYKDTLELLDKIL